MGLHFSDTLVGKVFEHLGGLSPKGGEPDPLALGPGANLPGVDPLKPLDGPQGHSHRDGPDMGGPNMGGPSLPQRSGPPTGGPAPQGMQDVFPNIALQITGNALSLANSASSQVLEAFAPPPHAHHGQPPQAVAHHARLQPVPGPMQAQTQARTQAVIIAAAPASAMSLANSQASSANANPLTQAWAQPASMAPRVVGDSAGPAQLRGAELASPPRAENTSLLGRVVAALHLGQAPAATPPAAVATALPPGATAATAAGLTIVAIPINPLVDARGIVLASNDHAATRVDNNPLLAGHTLEGMQRRSTRHHVQGQPSRMSRLLLAMGLIGTPSDQSAPHPRRDIQNIMQWLFWMLAIIAYGCLAAAIVALASSNGHLLDYQTGRTYTGWLAFFGLFTAVIAWWLARRMTRPRS